MQTLAKAPKTILVTGCAGFIGSSFCTAFTERFPRTKVIGVDNFATGRRERVSPKIVLCEGSITDSLFLEDVFKTHKPEYVFHFAAVPRVSYSVEHPAETTFANIYGTSLVLEKARDHKVQRVVYSSSSSVYGGAKKLPTKEKENAPNPLSPYALQKYFGEPMCQISSSLYGLDTVCLRYFNVFGPWQYGDSPYATVISGWLEGLYFPGTKKLFLEGDGKQSRDFCFVDNVVEANIQAMLAKGPLRGVALNIAHGERTTLREVKRLIEHYTHKRLDLEYRPPRLGDVRHSLADIRLAKKLIGYRPAVHFEEGLRRTVAWYEGRRK